MQIEDVRNSIGKEAGACDWIVVTQELVDHFADLTGDRQWIHVNRERARRESPFGTTIAHGFLTVALLSRMVHNSVDLKVGAKMRVNYGFNKLRFPAPLRVESRIRTHVTPNAVRDVEGGIEIAWGIVVEIENQPKPALAAEWLVRIYF